MENENITKAKEEFLNSIKENRSLLFKLFSGNKIKKLESARETEFFELAYEIYKDTVNKEASSKLDEIDKQIDALFKQLKAEYKLFNKSKYGLQMFGEEAITGFWEDTTIPYDGYYDKYNYYISYYPEVGFIAGNDNSAAGSSNDVEAANINSLGKTTITYVALGDERRDVRATVERFLTENEKTLLEIHKKQLEKIQILCNEVEPKKESDSDLCQKAVQLFSTAISSIKPKSNLDNEEITVVKNM